MAQNEILFSIVENARDGVTFSVPGHQVKRIRQNKEEVLRTLRVLQDRLTSEHYPFTDHSKEKKS